MAAKSGKPATGLLSGLLLCEDCGPSLIASNQHGYQCATRTYGGLSACANKTRINRDRAETAIVDYISDELLSREAIALAQRVYEKATREAQSALQSVVQVVPDHLLGEENKLREMVKAGVSSAEVSPAGTRRCSTEAPQSCSSRCAANWRRRGIYSGSGALQEGGKKSGHARRGTRERNRAAHAGA
jgi:hypothetical protein